MPKKESKGARSRRKKVSRVSLLEELLSSEDAPGEDLEGDFILTLERDLKLKCNSCKNPLLNEFYARQEKKDFLHIQIGPEEIPCPRCGAITSIDFESQLFLHVGGFKHRIVVSELSFDRPTNDGHTQSCLNSLVIERCPACKTQMEYAAASECENPDCGAHFGYSGLFLANGHRLSFSPRP